MFCPNCGKELDADAKFCFNCGFSVESINKNVQNKQVRVQSEPVQMQAEPEGVSMQPIEPEPMRRYNEPENVIERAGDVVPAAYSNQVVDVSMQEDGYDYRNLPTEKPTGIHSIYPLDFLIRMTQKENIPTLIYLCVNVLIVGVVFTAVFALPFVWGLISGLIVYAASVIVALSPIFPSSL